MLNHKWVPRVSQASATMAPSFNSGTIQPSGSLPDKLLYNISPVADIALACISPETFRTKSL